MASKSMGRAVIAHAQPIERLGICAVLGRTFSCEVADHFDALANLVAIPTLVALLGWELPGLTSLEQIDRLHRQYPEMRIAVLVAECSLDMIIGLLSCGARGVISRNIAGPDLLQALRMVAGGVAYVSAEICRDTVGVLRQGHEEPLLSRRQMQVVELASEGRSNKEIARLLGIAEATVKVHISAAFRSMGVRNRTAAVAALRQGNGRAAIDLLNDMYEPLQAVGTGEARAVEWAKVPNLPSRRVSNLLK